MGWDVSVEQGQLHLCEREIWLPAAVIICMLAWLEFMVQLKNIKQTQSFKEIVLANSQLYLEAKNTADEDKHDENQAHVTESSNLLFVGEVIRLGKSEGQNELQVCAGSRYQTGKTSATKIMPVKLMTVWYFIMLS